MAVFIHQLSNWPKFFWNQETIEPSLHQAQFSLGHLLGRLADLGFSTRSTFAVQELSETIVRSAEIEGEILNLEEVRSSIAKRLGIQYVGSFQTSRSVDAMVEMMMDATGKFSEPLSKERLCSWQAALFPNGYSGMFKIEVGQWRTNPSSDPMQVVSGASGRDVIHFKAPDSVLVPAEMDTFLHWVNTEKDLNSIIKAAMAHFWFVTIHPFDDGNGRISRAITEYLLAQFENQPQRFYSISNQMRIDRNNYYRILEETQKGNLDITIWLQWFLQCFERSLTASALTLDKVLIRVRFWERNAGVAFNARQQKMLSLLLDHYEGKLNAAKWSKIAKVSHDTALRDINDLISKGVLIKEASFGKNTSYVLR